ncbi:MAG: heavy metal translocating P-type ATPase [Rhodomicrobium sp.]
MTDLALAAYPPEFKTAAESAAPHSQFVTLAVENMTCGGCMRKVEAALAAVPGVGAARANLSERRVTVAFDGLEDGAAKLVDALGKAGFTAAELAPGVSEKSKAGRSLLGRVAVAGFASANIMLLSVSAWSGASPSDEAETLFHWLSALIALPSVAYAGVPFFASAYGVLKNRRVNMDVPISLALVLSAGMSLFETVRGSEQVYFDACVTLLFFLLIGRYLDERVRIRARGAAENLLSLRSEWANVIGSGGAVERLAARLVKAGMRIAVATGDRFPADGAIAQGASSVDESLITGETAPRYLHTGDAVYAGSVNLSAPVVITASGADSDSLLSQIARLMAAAEQARGRYVRLADRAARLYAPMVHTLAAASFVGWMIAGAGWAQALTVAISVLIITCPCALALAVPAVQVAASARLFARGILVKAPDGLERLAEADTIVFDKTGTLTLGVPQLANAHEIEDGTLKAASALASVSVHPYAKAIAVVAECRFGAVTPASEVIERPGAGLARSTGAGEERLGSAEWCGAGSGKDGSASLWYAAPGTAPVAFHFEDKLRPDAAQTIAALEHAGYSVHLLSGDRHEAVESAAEAAGIEDWTARLKPQEKIERLSALKEAGKKVLMVGDGLNDAPALAAAHASLSPATAASISQTASDAIFQGASLRAVVELLNTARKAKTMSFQNFAVAFGYNIIFVPLAMAGFVTPLVAAIAMSTSSIAVTANALRLRTMRMEALR